MDRNLRWRSLFLVVLLAFCVCTLLPSFVDGLPKWFTDRFSHKIKLGTDIDGGARVVYSIDLNKAVDDKASEIRRDLETKLGEGEWKGKLTISTPSTPVGAVTIKGADPAKKDEVKRLVLADYRDQVVERPCAPNDGPGAICVVVSSTYSEGIRKSALHNAVNTIRDRIDEKGIAEPSVVPKGDDVIVELPGLEEDTIRRIRETIARTAKLEFKIIDDGSQYMQKLFAHVKDDPRAAELGVKTDTDTWRGEESTTQHNDWFLFAYDHPDEEISLEEAKEIGCYDKKKSEVVNGKVKCLITGRRVIERYLKELVAKDPTFVVPDDRQLAFEQITPDAAASDQKKLTRTWYLDRAIRLSGSAITNAQKAYDPNTNKPYCQVDFNSYGGRVFGDLTSQNVGEKMAIILDDKVSSAPVINGPIRGGRASITMGSADVTKAEAEADDLVAVLKTGSLPAPLREESAATVGPTLGRDAVDRAKLSFGLGVILVVLIMVGIYKWSGWLAVGAVLINVMMQLTAMALFGATLTLPGIAAVVLTVGMGVDGNILIYERIREELHQGKSVRGAVDVGFSRAFSAILDGHFTTATAGWVLLQYGSGPIKGFAVMLLVGIVTNLFTNTWVSRLFFDWYLVRKKSASATISI